MVGRLCADRHAAADRRAPERRARQAARSPDVAKKFAEQIDMEIVAGTPEQFAAFQASEQERWFKVIKDNDIKGD